MTTEEVRAWVTDFVVAVANGDHAGIRLLRHQLTTPADVTGVLLLLAVIASRVQLAGLRAA